MEPPRAQIIDLFAALKASLNPRKPMDARRSPVTETAASTTDTTTTNAETPPAPKRDRGTTTDGVKAGQVFERLQALDEDEAAELANAPASIRVRFDERRQRELSKVSEGVRQLVAKMRGQ